MYFSTSFLLTSLVAAGGALAGNSQQGSSSQCPDVWSSVARKLKDTFGDCNSNARMAIRLPFHDCWNGACDGSIILTNECTARSENAQLRPICQTLGDMADEFNVGVADLIQVAAAVATAACPPSPTIKVLVGRPDSHQPGPENQIPPPTLAAPQMISLFQQKGFSVEDLVSLVGAHSAGVNRNGTAFDTTVHSLDSPTFYRETAAGTAPTSLFSDRSLANDSASKADWTEYAENQGLWDEHFATAMQKMAVLGVNNQGSLVDCTTTIFGYEHGGFW